MRESFTHKGTVSDLVWEFDASSACSEVIYVSLPKSSKILVVFGYVLYRSIV